MKIYNNTLEAGTDPDCYMGHWDILLGNNGLTKQIEVNTLNESVYSRGCKWE